MKVIDLLNKIAKGEIEEDVMFEYSHENGYKEYCTARQFFNRYIVDKENLNLEIWEDKVEDKEIEKLDLNYYHDEPANIDDLAYKVNEIIDKLNEIEYATRVLLDEKVQEIEEETKKLLHETK